MLEMAEWNATLFYRLQSTSGIISYYLSYTNHRDWKVKVNCQLHDLYRYKLQHVVKNVRSWWNTFIRKFTMIDGDILRLWTINKTSNRFYFKFKIWNINQMLLNSDNKINRLKSRSFYFDLRVGISAPSLSKIWSNLEWI